MIHHHPIIPKLVRQITFYYSYSSKNIENNKDTNEIIEKSKMGKLNFSKFEEIKKLFEKRIQRDISKTPQGQDMTQINDELTKAFKKFNLPEVNPTSTRLY